MIGDGDGMSAVVALLMTGPQAAAQDQHQHDAPAELAGMTRKRT
jgi:hypothetical protein